MENLPSWLQIILGLIILVFYAIFLSLPFLLMGLGIICFVYGIIPLLKTLVTKTGNKDLQLDSKKGLKRRAIIAGAGFFIGITGFVLLRIWAAFKLDNPL